MSMIETLYIFVFFLICGGFLTAMIDALWP